MLLALAACASPADPRAQESSPLPDGWRLELPEGYESWRMPLETRLAEVLAQCTPLLARWPQDAPPLGRVLRVVTPLAAQELYAQQGWEGNPQVPRTFPGQALSVVPLPREDRLLRNPRGLPQTWLHDLSHEAMHLACVGRTALDEAPLWFVEGLAEWACLAADPGAPEPGAWPHWTTADRWGPQSNEGLQCARRRAVQELCLAEDDPQPWRLRAEPRPAAQPVVSPESLRLLRGRHAGWWPRDGIYLLAPVVGALVILDLPLGDRDAADLQAAEVPLAIAQSVSVEQADAALAEAIAARGSATDRARFLWSGAEPLRLRLQAGDSGRYADAGLLLVPADGVPQGWLRLRVSASGAFLAGAEHPGDRPDLEPLQLDADTPRDGSREVQVSLDGDLLRVEAGSFRRSFPLAEHALAPPFALRLYAFDTALRAELLPASAVLPR